VEKVTLGKKSVRCAVEAQGIWVCFPNAPRKRFGQGEGGFRQQVDRDKKMVPKREASPAKSEITEKGKKDLTAAQDADDTHHCANHNRVGATINKNKKQDG